MLLHKLSSLKKKRRERQIHLSKRLRERGTRGRGRIKEEARDGGRVQGEDEELGGEDG